MLYFPHDLDFFGSASMSLVGNGDLARMLEDPASLSSYYGHLQDIVDRADGVMNDSPDALMALYPPLDFRITTGGGADFSVASTEVVLEGEAWLDVRQIALDGAADPLELTWVDDLNWQVTVPLGDGPNDVTLVATDIQGAVVGTDSIVVTSTAGG